LFVYAEEGVDYDDDDSERGVKSLSSLQFPAGVMLPVSSMTNYLEEPE
jgi:hypothetical protein